MSSIGKAWNRDVIYEDMVEGVLQLAFVNFLSCLLCDIDLSFDSSCVKLASIIRLCSLQERIVALNASILFFRCRILAVLAGFFYDGYTTNLCF